MMPTSGGEADPNASASAAAEDAGFLLSLIDGLGSEEGVEPAMHDAGPGQPFTKVKSDGIRSSKHILAKLLLNLTRSARQEGIGGRDASLRLPEACLLLFTPDGKLQVIASSGFTQSELCRLPDSIVSA
jgi:hypothetical protein